ncbi:MAG: hypothetical protein AAGC79_08945 [Pseudomonadota bacterium]
MSLYRAVVFALVTIFSVVPVRAEQTIVLSGLPVWDSAALLALVEDQPLEGVSFSFSAWRTPDQLNALLLNGRVQIASAPSPLLPLLRIRGLKAQLLASSAIEGNLQLIGRAGAEQIAVPFRGGLPDLILRRLQQDRPDLAREIRYTATPAEAMQLMLAGHLDAAFLAEPLAGLALSRGEDLRPLEDICAAWASVTGGPRCPVTGIYLAYRLDQALAKRIEGALAKAYLKMVADPKSASRLLRSAFPMLADLPLDQTFEDLGPRYYGPCQQGPLLASLAELDPLSPIALAGPFQAALDCQE